MRKIFHYDAALWINAFGEVSKPLQFTRTSMRIRGSLKPGDSVTPSTMPANTGWTIFGPSMPPEDHV